MSSVDITKLVNEIKTRAQEYYEGHATISDHEFDILTDKLYKLDPDNPILKTTGWGYIPQGNIIPHAVPMYGLDKIVDDAQADIDWMNEVSDLYIITPKYDGCSVVVTYDRAGNYKSAATRGDSNWGTNITEKLRNKVPQTVGVPRLSVRGELVIKNEVFSKYANSKHPRNLATGFANSDSNSTVDPNDVDVVFYTWVNSDIDQKLIRDGKLTKVQSLQMLKLMGFNTTCFERVCSDTDYLNHPYMDKDFTYPTDGIVLTANMPTFNKYPRWREIASKTNRDTATTTVVGIEWSFDRDKYVPILELDPVNLSGSTIGRVSAYNIEKLVNEYHVGIGSEVVITRSGGVIPTLVDVITTSDDIRAPKMCYSCGTDLEQPGANLVCPNPYCPAKLESSVTTWIKWLADLNGVKGMGGAAFDQIFSNNKIESIIDFFVAIPNIIENVDYYRKPVRDLFGNPNGYTDLDLSTAIQALRLPSLGNAGVNIVANYLDNHIKGVGDYHDTDWIDESGLNVTQVEMVKVYWPIIIGVLHYVRTKEVLGTLEELRKNYSIQQ